MSEPGANPPGLLGQARKAALTGTAALHNRSELFLVEFQEEKVHLMELLLWTAICGLLGMIFLAVFTATIILLFPEGWRICAAAGFSLFYLLATVLAVINLRALWRSTPEAFTGTIAEAQKDAEWLESLK